MANRQVPLKADERQTYSVRGTALESGYTGKYIRDLLYEGRIPGASKNGRNWVIPKESVELLRRRKKAAE